MKCSHLLLCLGLCAIWSCNTPTLTENLLLLAPSGDIQLHIDLDETGAPYYQVRFQDQAIIDQSSLGFEFNGFLDMKKGFKIISTNQRTVDESWELPWGEQRVIRDHFQELTVELQETDLPNRSMTLIFRAYDDGIAFRYSLPEMAGVDSLFIEEECSTFNLTGDHTTFWSPGDWDIYEHIYQTTPITQINALAYADSQFIAQTYVPENSVNTPVTFRTEAGVHLSIHEAALTNYAGMTLKRIPDSYGFVTSLVGSKRQEYKVGRGLPFETPWRCILIGDEATDLLDSRMILNLNEPNMIGEVPWIQPTKYLGIWWEYHLGLSTWDYESGKHGATTEKTKAIIDFAAENNIGTILVEGWNTGWDRKQPFDFVTPYPDYDLTEVVRYGNENGVKLIMHHETYSNVLNYEAQMDTAFKLMEELGIHAVKTGYVGSLLPEGEYHHGQWMVNHYRNVLQEAAQKKIAINAHEPIMATGIRRTYPNAISREGLRGQEFSVYSYEGGNRPEHLPIVAYTRMLAGPVDYTPGAFEFDLAPARPGRRVQTTLAHQLALYVVVYSPLQMACDLIENYQDQPAFQFIRDVAVDWEQSLALQGEVGDFVVMAREERGTGNWFVGAITDEVERQIEISFDFLKTATSYQAQIYKDGDQAHWDTNPKDIAIESINIRKNDKIAFTLKPGGGLAISLKKIN
ncbi:MAG: glycoside hydrolase family 97 protein [Bacteroidota bacterium]